MTEMDGEPLENQQRRLLQQCSEKEEIKNGGQNE